MKSTNASNASAADIPTAPGSTPEPSRLPELPVHSRMRAIVYDDYGGVEVLHEAEIDTPTRLPGQILIEVAAASVNPIDYRLRQGEMKGIIPGGFPRVPGFDVAGIVADCGGDNQFTVGDRVLAFLDHTRGGGYARYATCAIDAAAKIPDEMSFETAAAIPLAGTTALQALRDHGKLKPGDRVLVNGASGGVGMFAVQIAKANDATVDAVASGANESFCKSLGADRFLNYETTDFTERNEKWDLIFDAAGKASYLDARQVMADGGRYVTTEPDASGILVTLLTWPLSKSGTTMMAHPRSDDLDELVRLFQQGSLTVTIDRCYPLQQAADAHRHIEAGVEHGKIILTVAAG